MRHLEQGRFNLVTCRSWSFAGWMSARCLIFLSITGSVTQGSVLVMVRVVSSHGPGMNYELQLTEDHFLSCSQLAKLRKAFIGTNPLTVGKPWRWKEFFPLPCHGEKCITSWQNSNIPVPANLHRANGMWCQGLLSNSWLAEENSSR